MKSTIRSDVVEEDEGSHVADGAEGGDEADREHEADGKDVAEEVDEEGVAGVADVAEEVDVVDVAGADAVEGAEEGDAGAEVEEEEDLHRRGLRLHLLPNL